MALGGGNKPGTQLRTRVPHRHNLCKPGRCTDAPGAHQRLAQRSDFLQQLRWRHRAGMSTGTLIDADKTINAAVKCLLCPAPVSDIVIHRDSGRTGPINDPARISECRHQERHLFFQCNIKPLMHTLQVLF